MVSERLFSALNDQYNFELYSAHIYIAMAAYFEDQDLEGFANFFKVQEQEERFHASKFYTYIAEKNGRIRVDGIPTPENDFESIIDVFKKAIEHERKVTERIYNLMNIAMEEKEHATVSFLKWFVDEQTEEEAMFNKIIKKLERIKDDPNGIYMLDAELAQRVFTPPANA